MTHSIKTFFCDVETTGTDPKIHGLIQLAGAIYDEQRLVESFNLSMRPFDADVVEDEALEVNGRTREQIAAFSDPVLVYRDFVDRLSVAVDRYDRTDKMHFVGYNANFDEDFVRKWFQKCGDEFFGSYFWFPVIDVCQIAGFRLMRDRAHLRNFRLMTVAEHFGIEMPGGNPHDAMHDVRVTMRLFKKLRSDLPYIESQLSGTGTDNIIVKGLMGLSQK